jgi:mono/diheme cytochrome c family protein
LLLISLGGCNRPSEPAEPPDQRAKLLTIPDEYKNRANPLPPNYGNLAEGRARYEQYCALCHGADGKAATLLGRSLYPAATDLTSPQTQKYTDGQLFWIVSEGIRYSGMPAARNFNTEDQSWRVVLYVRRLAPPAPR